MSPLNRESADTDTVLGGSPRVAGERSDTVVHRALSMQSRATRILTLGLAGALLIGILSWYYLRTFNQQARAQEDARAATVHRAQTEVNLPPIGRIDPPDPVESESRQEREGDAAHDAGLAEPEALSPMAEVFGTSSLPPPYPTPVEKTPAQIALERRLSGTAFATSTVSVTATMAAAVAEHSPDAAPPESPLASLLKPSYIPTARTKLLPTRRLLLPKGAFIDCTLETAIDSTLPGMTTCIAATDTFGADGTVVLLERGTKLIGETRGQVQQGSSRIFVLWTEARTPSGVVVPLDSPGTDELGRSGLPGEVNRHFWDRFGAAILISTLDGVTQSVAQSGNRNGAIIYNPSSSRDLVAEVLKDTVNIRPTVVKARGDRIQILVARDLDFRPVYELRSSTSGR